jgi:hypothetical protein
VNSSDYAYLSNYGVYSAIALFAVAFIAHALDVAFSVRSLEEKTKLDFSRTRRIGNLATVMIVLAFIALFVAVLFRGISEICMNSRLPELLHLPVLIFTHFGNIELNG